jgi:hypothetical protein
VGHTPRNFHRFEFQTATTNVSDRHCEPTGRRKAPPDDRLREAIHFAEQRKNGLLRRFAPLNDGLLSLVSLSLPPRSGGEGSRVGVVPRMPLSANLPIDPPPPTPQSELRSSRPHHALARAEGGEKTHIRLLAAQNARAMPNLPPIEGAGNAGRPMRPRSRVRR